MANNTATSDADSGGNKRKVPMQMNTIKWLRSMAPMTNVLSGFITTFTFFRNFRISEAHNLKNQTKQTRISFQQNFLSSLSFVGGGRYNAFTLLSVHRGGELGFGFSPFRNRNQRLKLLEGKSPRMFDLLSRIERISRPLVGTWIVGTRPQSAVHLSVGTA